MCSNSALSPDMVACEHCGKPEHKSKLKKKRFCSLACARQAKSSIGEQAADSATVASTQSSNDYAIMDSNAANKLEANAATLPSPNAAADKKTDTFVPPIVNQQMLNNSASGSMDTSSSSAELPQMVNWSVSEVCEFIKNLPGCTDYVDDFEQQEIDGQALLLLKENHLVNAMGMKLGPALKIVAKVESMKESANPNSSSNNINEQPQTPAQQ